MPAAARTAGGAGANSGAVQGCALPGAGGGGGGGGNGPAGVGGGETQSPARACSACCRFSRTAASLACAGGGGWGDAGVRSSPSSRAWRREVMSHGANVHCSKTGMMKARTALG